MEATNHFSDTRGRKEQLVKIITGADTLQQHGIFTQLSDLTPLGCVPLRQGLTAVDGRTLPAALWFRVQFAHLIFVDLPRFTAADDQTRLHGFTAAVRTLKRLITN